MANGLVLLNTTTVTASATLTVDSVFSSAYRNYLIVLDGVGSTTVVQWRARLRAAGSTAAGSDYTYQLNSLENTSNVLSRTTGTFWQIGGIQSGGTNHNFLTLFSPNLAVNTRVECRGFDQRMISQIVTGIHGAASAYDGIQISAASGTFDITANIYGYVFS